MMLLFFFFKQKTAYEMRISDWSSDVCSSDLVSGGKGAININVLWEMGGAQQILEGVLERTKGLVAGVTCGAGMPYKLSEIAARHNVLYQPIISLASAFRALWKRAYSTVAHLLGEVVGEVVGSELVRTPLPNSHLVCCLLIE